MIIACSEFLSEIDAEKRVKGEAKGGTEETVRLGRGRGKITWPH